MRSRNRVHARRMACSDMDALFAIADIARKEADAENGEDDLQEDDDPRRFFANAPQRKVSQGRAICHPLPDGDFHMCFGLRCEHLTLDRERQLVCTVTGMIVGVEHSRDYDAAWTGRSTGSANPDDNAGTPLGGWVRRRDMFSASVTAYRNAHNISDAEIVLHTPSVRPCNTDGEDPCIDGEGGAANAAGGTGGGRATVKRGALCVDETPIDAPHGKRQRAPRRESLSREALEKLSTEAMHVISALLIVELSPSAARPTQASPAQAQPSSSQPQPPKTVTVKECKLDPRLQNLEFVRNVALRKYVRACSEGKQALNMNVLHDVCVYANEFVRAQRSAAQNQQQLQLANENSTDASLGSGCGKRHQQKAQQQQQHQQQQQRNRRGPGFSGQVRNLIANLIVSLWRAACATPHMRDNKRGNDSFRPFAAGVLYSFKRGIYLDDGMCVVPALDALAVHLPALRSPQSTPAAKQLQSSSHRGICSFHRSISSMETMEADEAAEVRRLFSDAAGQAAFLRALVHRDGEAQR